MEILIIKFIRFFIVAVIAAILKYMFKIIKEKAAEIQIDEDLIDKDLIDKDLQEKYFNYKE